MKDKVECFTFADIENDISSENRSKLNVAKILATDPHAFRLVVIDNMPSHQRLVMKHAILNAWDKQHIPWSSIAISDFTDEVVLAIKSGKPFNPCKFTDDDNLLIDDLQWILDKPSCQEEFVRTVLKRRLERRTKLTVLFCEYPLPELVSLTDELRNLLKIGIKEGTL